jgi:hypothetical protein
MLSQTLIALLLIAVEDPTVGTGTPRRDNVADLLECARTMDEQLLTLS